MFLARVKCERQGCSRGGSEGFWVITPMTLDKGPKVTVMGYNVYSRLTEFVFWKFCSTVRLMLTQLKHHRVLSSIQDR